MATQEYSVKLGNPDNKEYNIMRFKPPHNCDLQQLTNPKLDRQETKEQDEGKVERVLEGEGTEYRQKEREDAKRRRRGFRARKANPADQPWILREHKKGGKHFIGRKEGGINSSASYYLLSLGANNSFEAYPISNWYNFVPPVKYNYLNDEEAEERFEKRHKTLNYFSIMMSKRIKEKTEDETDPLTVTSKAAKDSDSEAEFSSVGSDTDDKPKSSSKGKKGKKGDSKKKRKASAAVKNDDSEAGEETDEGDMESQEMDYYSTTSSDGEEERLLKEVKEQPRDDAEVERKEEGGIDEVFGDKSSSSSDEGEDLTESGKELKAIIRKQEPVKEEEEEELESEEESKESNQKTSSPSKGSAGSTKRVLESPSVEGPSKKKIRKEEEEKQPIRPDRITTHEVYKYLSRKPMTSKALMKKFIKLKPEMDKDSITGALAAILNSSMSLIETQVVDKKKRYSIRSKGDS
ncbi:PREDICTED: general transcription factor IIF subunit 1-like [Amphimedon queenslandica]|uniref:Transcription initiation factor IIF subunit alpha n=1 Tax=Amphimedon queenslandica TaxID=400682 RepID=A0A1X7VEJ8_AMPQE|nr:PREDICTED: general transcription factor IIF subunit 1-like [Amphimedon queenslandica]|eukprot:XP_003384721.1 PREDICTED: general transcription factor IIF subunit 1-like [Amphimedon queenslandica]